MLSRESCANEILPQYLQLLMTTRQIRLNYLNVCIEVKELKINIIYVRQPFSLVDCQKQTHDSFQKGKIICRFAKPAMIVKNIVKNE